MKRKIWVISPLMYIMVVVMLIFALTSYRSDRIIFAVELTATGLAAVAVVAIRLHFRSHVNLAVRSARKILTAEGEHELNELPLAVVVVGLQGDIVWCNNTFSTVVGSGKDVLGETILPYIYPRTLRQVSGEKGTSVSTGGKEFTVYTSRMESSYVMYFVDDTYFKAIHREYRDKKTVISIIAFDNREELIRDASGGDESRITAEVESVLREWATGPMGGFVRKLSGDRYIMISDEEHMEQAKKRRFEVLDSVRKVKGQNNLTATISIGIGRGAASAAESETWARQALDMALGRGGDQVAVMKKGDTYEFYGGLSKGIEKRDKVRTRVIASTLLDHIKASDRVYIMGHKNSDLDSVGASVGMWAAVTKGTGRIAHVVVDKNGSLATPLIEMIESAKPDKKIFISPNEAMQDVTDKTLLVVVDTHSYSFVENADLLNAVKKIVVIDHHRMMVTHIKNSVIFYHEPYASSASEMVAELIQYMENASIDNYEAQALLAGIMLDTKNFILKTGVRTFEASAYLKRKGADTVQVKKLFANSPATNKEKSALVGSAEIYKGCAIAYTEESSHGTRVAAAQAADELLSIQGVRASFVLFRTGSDVNISARSLGEVNVQVILEAFGGGGHLTMAGAQIKNVTVEEAKSALMENLDDRLDHSINTARTRMERKEKY